MFKFRQVKKILIVFILFGLMIFLTGLGCWQLKRGIDKQKLLSQYETQMKQMVSLKDLNTTKNLRFFQIELKGKLDNEHTILLDNKTFHGQIGYEVFTPFYIDEIDQFILIDRGFIPIRDRKIMPPFLANTNESTKIKGLINLPPNFRSFNNQMVDSNEITWPLRIEFIQLKLLSEIFGKPLYEPYIVSLAPNHPLAFQMEWQIVMMQPERHFGYAFQWFALALTLLILSLAALRQRVPKK